MSVFTAGGELSELDPHTRARYLRGMIIGDDELRQDQRYVLARDEQHQRALHGWGVVCGLELAFGDDDHLEVRPGLAVDHAGRSICVPVTQCADLAAWIEGQAVDVAGLPGEVEVWVTLCHDECLTKHLPIRSGPCRTLDDSLQATRVTDSFRLELSLDRPPVRGDLAALDGAGVFETLLDRDAELGDKRAALSAFVTGRGAPEAFADRCLAPLEPGCVVLGRVAVPMVDQAGAATIDGPMAASWLRTDDRALVMSTQFLQEWLLRIEGGGTVTVIPEEPEPAPIPLGDLVDVAAPTARWGNVVVGAVEDDDIGTGRGTDAPGPANARWVERQLELRLLADVDIPDGFGAPGDRGLVLKYDGRRWRPQRDEVGGGTVIREEEPHVLSRPARYAVVAAGVMVVPVDVGDFVHFGDAHLLTAYGGLRVDKGADADGIGAVFHLNFAGYQEAFETYRRLDGRQFVVKATPESATVPLAVQVVRPTEDGIAVILHCPANHDEIQRFTGFLAEQGLEAEPTCAVHLEISVFDDERVGNDGLDKIESLRRPV